MKRIVFAIAFLMAISCTRKSDCFLDTLSLVPEPLEAVDSIDIDRFNLFQARNVVSLDDGWLVLSSVKGEYNLLFLNPSTSEHFFAIRKGRGPGEVITGNSLHRYEDGAAFYDAGNATCLKIGLKMRSGGPSVTIDTIGAFTGGPSRPVYMTTCGAGGFISGNLINEEVWYSYYDDTGHILSDIDMLHLDEFAAAGDKRISWMLSSVYTADPAGKRVCVANVMSPSLSFSKVDAGMLREYRRISHEPYGIANGSVTEEFRSAFNGIDSDDEYVYVLYSGNKMKGESLPPNECRHLIVYDWDGNPVRHYLLDRNVSSVQIDRDTLWCASTYPESRVFRFQIPSF